MQQHDCKQRLTRCPALHWHTQADISLEFTWVDSSGTVHTSSRSSPEGHGLAGGVGLWGIITEVRIQMTPPSNTKAISINLIKDGNIGVEVQGYAKVRLAASCRANRHAHTRTCARHAHMLPRAQLCFCVLSCRWPLPLTLRAFAALPCPTCTELPQHGGHVAPRL